MTITIELALALPDVQFLQRLEIPAGSSAQQALAHFELPAALAHYATTPPALAIFGKICQADILLNDGDRLEILRPLVLDPKEIRRRRAQRAQQGQTAPTESSFL